MAARRAVSRAGAARQRMSFRFRSTADSASWRGSMEGPRFIILGPIFPRAFSSQPVGTGVKLFQPPAEANTASQALTSGSAVTLILHEHLQKPQRAIVRLLAMHPSLLCLHSRLHGQCK